MRFAQRESGALFREIVIGARWDASFVTVDDEVLFNLILAANYLDIKALLDLTCKKVPQILRSHSAVQ